MVDLRAQQDNAIRIPGRSIPDDIHTLACVPGPLFNCVGEVMGLNRIIRALRNFAPGKPELVGMSTQRLYSGVILGATQLT